MVAPYICLIVMVGVERLVELWVSHRHAQRAFARGGLEFGQEHFGFMRVLHTALLLGCLLEPWLFARPFTSPASWMWLGLVVVAQMLRYWAVFSLGEAWNVRVIVVPDAQASHRGPYRFLKHPNYVAVVLEGVALPMVHGAYITASLFTVLNAWLLRRRIACEELALKSYLKDYARVGQSAG